jgi:hypothetical protein
MILAVTTDTLQIFMFPIFAEGVLSPRADDVLDLQSPAVLVRLLGWHREFCLPSPPNLCRESIWFRSGCSRSANVYRKWADGGQF